MLENLFYYFCWYYLTPAAKWLLLNNNSCFMLGDFFFSPKLSNVIYTLFVRLSYSVTHILL